MTGFLPSYYLNGTGIADYISGYGAMYGFMMISTLTLPVANYATQIVGILKVIQNGLRKHVKLSGVDLYNFMCIFISNE